MPSVVHVITTGNFAGVERYVCNAAVETAARGWETTVVGGDAERMPTALQPDVRWLPGATPAESLRSLARVGRQDLCHAHLTIAEALAVAARPLHRGRVVSTRHFAAARGSSWGGRLLAPWISARLARQIAVSDYVAKHIERRPDAVIRNGVPPSPRVWQSSSRVVLVLQRLEREKDTFTALRAWRASGLVEEGWSLRVVGAGSERAALEAWTRSERVPGVFFTGWTAHVSDELAGAGIFLAPASGEPFGLGVVEAMAAGVPVVACAAGGHLETVGLLLNAPMFPPGDTDAAAKGLRSLLSEDARAAMSRAGLDLVEEAFTISRHVDQLLVEYETILGRAAESAGRGPHSSGKPPAPRLHSGAAEKAALRELVVCSLEAWDDVWRRNQFFTDILLRRNSTLRVLFIEPAADPLFDLWSRRAPVLPRLRSISADGRLLAFRPLKPLPRRFGHVADTLVRSQVELATRLVGFSRPTLWINDVTYAPLIARTRWPSIYDVTDDWLLAPFSPRELERLQRLDELALAEADEVVVCSPALAATRGARRPVSLVPNGVDVEHFRRPRARPHDLPESPVAVYVGSLHDSRIDVGVVIELAEALPQLRLVFVGPNSLSHRSQRLLDALPNVLLLGARPYRDVPAYLQHADVVIVPHRVTPFTESLDPIKAYESLAVGVPTVATPVSGFRGLDGAVTVATGPSFTAAVESTLTEPPKQRPVSELVSWEERAREFEQVAICAQAALQR
jgi:glycosyltransferase involved in cell wall biosynthesis